MNKTQELQKELEQLRLIIHRTVDRLSVAPNGSLELRNHHNGIRYQQKAWNPELKKPNRHYLSPDEMDLIKALAQKGYDQRLLKAAQKQQDTIADFLDDYNPHALSDIYAALPDARKDLISAEVLDDETFAMNWEVVNYSPAPFQEGLPEFYSIRGERVRSKSEKIIADTLYAKHKPYKYEPPLRIIQGQKPWRPDFLVLNPRTRKEYIWEHFGMMDDPDYCNRNVRKLELYTQQGIFLGDKLILTMETSSNPLSTKTLDSIIQQYLE